MPDRIDAAMDAMEPLGAQALPNPGVPNAEVAQLLPSDDAVLDPRQRRQARLEVGLVAFWVHFNP